MEGGHKTEELFTHGWDILDETAENSAMEKGVICQWLERGFAWSEESSMEQESGAVSMLISSAMPGRDLAMSTPLHSPVLQIRFTVLRMPSGNGCWPGLSSSLEIFKTHLDTLLYNLLW